MYIYIYIYLPWRFHSAPAKVVGRRSISDWFPALKVSCPVDFKFLKRFCFRKRPSMRSFVKQFCLKKRPNMSLFGFLVCLCVWFCFCVSVFLFVRSSVCLVGWLPQRFIRLRLEGFKVQDSGLWLLYASHAETTRSFGCCEKPKSL